MAHPLTPARWQVVWLWPLLLAQYISRALLALLLAWPLSRLISDPTASLPRGDRVLFDEGAMYLAEIVRLRRPEITAVAEGHLGIALLVAYAGLVPLGAVLAALTAALPQTLPQLFARTWRGMGTLSLLLGASLVAVALAVSLPQVVFGLLEDKLSGALDDVRHDLVEGAFGALGGLAIALVAAVHDLARLAAIGDERGAFFAVLHGWSAFRRHPFRVLLGWSARTLTAAVFMSLAALFTTRCGVETPWRLAAVLLVHQGVIFALIVLRADWLMYARDLLSVAPARDTLDRNDALADPTPGRDA